MTSDQVTVLSCNGFCVYNQGVLLPDITLFLVISAILMYIYVIYLLSDTEAQHRMMNILQFFVIHILFSVADEIYTHLQYIGYKNQSSSLQ